VAEHADDVETWLGINSYLDHPPNLQYTVCLYWTINTMLGERSSPQDQMSTLLSLFLSVAGIFMYFGYGSLLLAYVGTMTMTNADFEKKMWLRASYLRKLQVPARLTHVIRVLGSFLWYRPGRSSQENRPFEKKLLGAKFGQRFPMPSTGMRRYLDRARLPLHNNPRVPYNRLKMLPHLGPELPSPLESFFSKGRFSFCLGSATAGFEKAV
jgi:hypothetical protein